MNAGDRHKPEQCSSNWEKMDAKSEVFILCGEELLDRAHKMAHEIEEHIRQVLERDNV